MRILSLQLQNLNSLAGCWEIDFTHPAYATDGLFAITGPTGAGKSTLLDAICLALYGVTPRLGKITQSDNQLMSRQAGDCLAEVAFETEQGRFRAHWSQRRARGKADGRLQAPQHELVEADSDKLIASTLRRTPQEVERLTGMDFDRFTRSMLLAQGEFAAFLKADGDQRAPLLEQITGTEIYSRISMQVHEIHAEVKGEHLRLKELCAQTRTLDEETIRELESRTAQLTHDSQELDGQIEQSRSALQWHADQRRMNSELATTVADLKSLNAEIQALAPEREQLLQAEQAAQLKHPHQAVLQARQRQHALSEQCSTRKQSVHQHETELTLQQKAYDGSRQALEQARLTLEQARPILKKARELEIERGSLQQQAAQATQVLTETRCRQHESEQAMQRQDAQLQELNLACERLDDYLQQHTADASLAARLPALQLKSEQYLSQKTALDQLQQERSDCEARRKAIETGQSDLQAELAQQRQAIQEQERQRSELRQAIAGLLDGLSESELQEQLESAAGRLASLQQAMDLATERARMDWTPLEHEIAMVGKQLELLTSQVQTNQGEEQRLREQREAQQRELTLQMRIASLEEMRHDLRPGEPCPLCGATEHPYSLELPSTGDEPACDELEQEIQLLAAQRDSLQRQERAEVANLEILKARLAHQQEAHQALEARLQQLALGSDPAQLKLELEQQRAACDALKNRRQRLSQLNQQLADAGTALEAGREQLGRLEMQQHRQAAELDSLVQKQQWLDTELAKTESAIHSLWQDIERGLSAVLPGPPSPDHLPQQLQLLEQRHQAYQDASSELQTLQPRLAELNTRLSTSRERLAALIERLVEQESAISQLDTRLAEIGGELQERTQGESAEALEQQLRAQLDQSEAEHTTAQNNLAGADKTLGIARQSLQETEEQLAQASSSLESEETTFGQELNRLGFADEATFAAALLGDHELATLKATWQQREQQRDRLQLKEQQLRESLDNHKVSAPGEQEEAHWQQQKDRLQAEHSAIQRQLGAINQQLQEDSQQKERLSEQLQQLQSLEMLLDQWQRLHQLVGSADGKKFRNFAQGLTFGLVIREANRHLRSMSDRYQLLADPLAPLQLQVIDDYQAGEIRSTRNLSGGESFLVSLALALGLSRLNSGGMRVDSLFLDEGFGSLDEDTLESALEALMELRQQGKLIGLISHVGALQERIATQVQVIPGNSGISRLEAPGCRRCEGGGAN